VENQEHPPTTVNVPRWCPGGAPAHPRRPPTIAYGSAGSPLEPGGSRVRMPSRRRQARPVGVGTRAAENACARYANVEAAGLYERALASAGRMPGSPPLRQLRAAHETLARIYERLGEYDRAMDELAAVRRLTGGDPLLEASAHLHEAWVRERAGRYPDALRRISRGLRRLEQASGRRAAQLRGLSHRGVELRDVH